MNEERTWKTEYFDEISSTNDYVKTKRGAGENLIAIAKKQTGGRGTKGRSFVSDEGGVYLSALTFYEDFPAKNAFLVMANAAVAVVKTLQYFHLQPVIKWANDIFVNGKKICGILIENTFSGARLACSVVGIGLNVNNRLSEELSGIATTMQRAAGKEFSVEAVTDRLVVELAKPHTMEEYLKNIGYLGKKATAICGEEKRTVTLLSVDEEGGLTVLTEQGERERFVTAEISIRVEE